MVSFLDKIYKFNKKMDTHLVFIIQAHEGEMPDGRVNDSCQLELIDTNLDNAVKRAKKLIKKKFYRLSMVIEKEN